ncbi:MAG TPA: efflux transporter outer membrane subunit [Stellaceae bacterium]|nr:efflux transporter outer membrane subunit [Stellaceae bacterium]
MANRIHIAAAAALLALGACTIGPSYRRPAAATPPAYKELDGWKPAQPGEAGSASAWWSVYHDPVLDSLERQVAISNQTLKASAAAFREASAIVAEARAGYFPTVSAAASGSRSSQPFSTSAGRGGGGSVVQNSFSAGPDVSWVPDIWGRIARTVESDVANAQASAADLAAARLSAQASLATDYFQLRTDDALKDILDATVKADQQALAIVRNQFNAGFSAQTDVLTAQTQLENAQAQDIALGVQRAALEHAIAVLIGKPPAELTLAPGPLATAVPVMPPGLPSTLLERRPDIAASERAMAAANAQIGIAETAYFPDLTLTGTLSFASTELGNLFSAANSAWSLGAQLAGTVFEGGLRGAQVAAARAFYDQNVALYRQTVLAAFQQVEDALASLRILGQQAQVQARALRDARAAEQLALAQYQAGTVAYTTVVVAQTTALGDEQTVLNLQESRLAASVTLIEALGGGWNQSQLPAIAATGP